MGSSHGTGTVDPQVAKVGPNRADISGLARGQSSDEINDRLGRPREGQRLPPGPRPHFTRLNLAGIETGRVLGTPLVQDDPRHAPEADFEPILADHSEAVFGWLPDVRGDWHPADAVRKLALNGGRVEAQFADGSTSTLANYGADGTKARLYRARVAQYLADLKGW